MDLIAGFELPHPARVVVLLATFTSVTLLLGKTWTLATAFGSSFGEIAYRGVVSIGNAAQSVSRVGEGIIEAAARGQYAAESTVIVTALILAMLSIALVSSFKLMILSFDDVDPVAERQRQLRGLPPKDR